MVSLKFPEMFSSGRVNLVSDKEAALSNLKLTIGASKQTLLGDPFFGTNIRKYTFSQNSQVLRDLIQDEIYSSIRVFVPQILCNRDDIKVEAQGAKITASIRFKYLTDQTVDIYKIDLFDEE